MITERLSERLPYVRELSPVDRAAQLARMTAFLLAARKRELKAARTLARAQLAIADIERTIETIRQSH